jgi:hypothetical protein
MIPVCPKLSQEGIKAITRACFSLSHQVDPHRGRRSVSLIAITENPDGHVLHECVHALSRQFELATFGKDCFIAIDDFSTMQETLRLRGLGYRHEGDIVVIAPSHEQGKYVRFVKAWYHPQAYVKSWAIPGFITADTWYENDAARNAVWREACELADLISSVTLPRVDCDDFLQAVEAFRPREECAA